MPGDFREGITSVNTDDVTVLPAAARNVRTRVDNLLKGARRKVEKYM